MVNVIAYCISRTKQRSREYGTAKSSPVSDLAHLVRRIFQGKHSIVPRSDQEPWMTAFEINELKQKMPTVTMGISLSLE
jgi:hypothetical protein